MSKASTTLGLEGPDFWEVTNFGTNEINLQGYRFHDRVRNGTTNESQIVIGSRESIIFVRVRANETITNREQFMQWWGPATPANLQVYFVAEPGLNATIDELILTDPDGRLVDRVALGAAQAGRSFTYNTNSGVFGELSSVANGAWRAATALDDVGSPGRTTGDIGLRITRPPQDRTFNGCARTSLDVQFVGMPRPRFQWFTNGIQVPNGAANPLLLDVIAPAQFTVQVRLWNGVHPEVLSSSALVTVTSSNVPPTVIEAPVDIDAFTCQRVRFTSRAEGYPCVQYQWFRDGAVLDGETSEALEFSADSSPGTHTYRVTIWNDLGSTNLTARLTAVPWPQLKVTEVMSYPDTNYTNRQDWLELTNCGTNSFNLRGCRFSDKTTLTGGFAISNDLFLAAGESMIFVEEMEAQTFRNWWGAANIPACLQVMTYHGFGLSQDGDGVFFWNAAAIDPYEYFTGVTFNRSLPGATLLMTNDCGTGCSEEELRGCVGIGDRQSVLGLRGAFRAELSEDVGSPGYSDEVLPGLWRCRTIILGIQRNGSSLFIVCSSTLGRHYQLEARESLSSGGWSPGESLVASGPTVTFTNAFLPADGMRFFRVLEF